MYSKEELRNIVAGQEQRKIMVDSVYRYACKMRVMTHLMKNNAEAFEEDPFERDENNDFQYYAEDIYSRIIKLKYPISVETACSP